MIITGSHRWLVTGAAGFIGMHLVDRLLQEGQIVRGVDSFITGKKARLDYLRKKLSNEHWSRFEFIEGDLVDKEFCNQVSTNCEFILHQAALGSVPESIEAPANTHLHNVHAFMNILDAARQSKVRRFVYASSSAIYGDDKTLPKIETSVGNALSPYAASKQIDEIYALNFQKVYGLQTVGLRYFNVFGPAQDPNGPYAAVIPLWILSLIKKQPVYINGDGTFSRDFCFISDIVNANILSALAAESATGATYNIARGEKTTILELYQLIQKAVSPGLSVAPIFRQNRAGDIPHSVADISLANHNLGFSAQVTVKQGLAETVKWYQENGSLFSADD